MSKSGHRLYEFGDFRLDASARLLSRQGVTAPLTPKAIDVLLALVQQPGQVLDKETLLKTVWPDSFVEENNLADNIFKLRRVLEAGENGRRFIETIPRRGYRFVADVRTSGQPPELSPVLSEPVWTAQPEPAQGRAESAAGSATITGWRRWVPWLAGGAMTLLVLALAVSSVREGIPDPSPMLKTSLLPPENASFGDIAVSPDGKWLAFTAATDSRVQLWLRSLASDEAKPVEATDGASHPFWSPDSRFVGFFAAGQLKKIGLRGDQPVTLCQASTGTGGTWNRDDVILFTALGVPQISRVSSSGGKPEVVLRAEPGQTDVHEPVFLPDGRRFLYLAINGTKDIRGIYVGSLDGHLRKRILEHDSNVLFVAGPGNDVRHGYLLFGREGKLVAQAFDSDALRVSGEPVPIAARLGTVEGANLSYRRRNFTAAANGLLIYDGHAGRLRSELLWVDRTGRPLNVLTRLDNVSVPFLSPDESRILVARKDLATNNNDLWLTDALGNNAVRFTFDPGSDLLGLWSPDGERIVWTSTRQGSFDLYEKKVSGAAQDALLLPSAEPKFPLDWSRDGRYLLYRQIGTQTGHDIFVLPMTGERTPTPYLQTAAMENGGAFSPDGRWIVYASDESGRSEIYVESFPTHGGRRQISLSGGSGPRWRADGKEVYYYSPDAKLMAVSISENGATLTTGPLTPLFAFRAAAITAVPSYAVARDGARFLLSAIVENDPNAALSVLQNWTAGIGR